MPDGLEAIASHRLFAIVLAVGLAAAQLACASKPPPPPKPWEIAQNAPSASQLVWTYMPKALTIKLTAAADLNPFEGDNHTILLCVYQLKTPTLFQELARTVGGLTKLLQCENFDPSVADVQRLFITPGEESTQVFDRAEGAVNVALVAGYYQLQPGNSALLDSYPILKSRLHVWSISSVYNPGPLTMNVLLSANSIQRMGLN